MSARDKPYALVSGGSIGGLCAAVALRSVGCEVDVLERAAGPMTGRGAGIVVQPDLLRLVARIEGASLPTTSCSHRRTVGADGGTLSEIAMPQAFTSWGAIRSTLRAALPDERYHAGAEVTAFEDVGRSVRLRTEQGAALAGDLLVLAEGSRSSGRDALAVEARESYAGYVAWRGVLGEADVADEQRRFFDDRFTFCEARGGGHALCYLIPGPEGSVEPGRRRLNWVWYRHVAAGPALDRVLTDRDGEAHRASVPPGALAREVRDDLVEDAARLLHPRFAALVAATAEPFVQAIADLAVERMVFGRTCLLGDAAFVVRPHTAGATAKAAGDAIALAASVAEKPDDLPSALLDYQNARLAAGRQMTDYGVRLGRRSVSSQEASR